MILSKDNFSQHYQIKFFKFQLLFLLLVLIFIFILYINYLINKNNTLIKENVINYFLKESFSYLKVFFVGF
jgi:uncharacterized membrane protein YesL